MRDPREHFAKKVRIVASGCHEWTAGLNRHGYGTCGLFGKGMLAHRAVFELAHGPIPDGLHVCHRCDNPRCVNIDHLFLGTHADNMADAQRKGRIRRGAAAGRAKLSEEQVLAIRERRGQGEKLMALASEFGVSHTTIRHIAIRKSWSHLV